MNFLIMQRPFVKKLSSSKKGEMKKKKASVENWKAFKVVHNEYLSKRIRFILRIDDFSFPEYFFFFPFPFSSSVLSKFFFILGASTSIEGNHGCLDRKDLGSSLWRVLEVRKDFFISRALERKNRLVRGWRGASSIVYRCSIPALRPPDCPVIRGHSNQVESSNTRLFSGEIFRYSFFAPLRFETRILDDLFFFYYYCKRRLQRHLKISLVQSPRGMKERCAKVWNESNFTSSKKFAHWFFRKREFTSAESGKRRWIEFPWWRKSGFSWFFFFPREKFLLNVTRACGRKACRKVCSLRVQIVDIIQNDITSNDRRNKRRIVLALVKMDRSLKLDLFTFSLDHF